MKVNRDSRIAKQAPVKGFKLDGKPLIFNALPPLAQKIKAFLDSQPEDELFRGEAVGTAIHVNGNVVRKTVARFKAEFTPYMAMLTHPRRVTIYGNPKAISEIKRQLESH